MALVDNLISWYNMEEASGNILDGVGSNDFVNDGADYGETGIIGDCLGFVTANTDKLNDNNHPAMADSAGSVSVWIKPTTFGSANNEILAEGSTTTGGLYCRWLLASSGTIYFTAANAGEYQSDNTNEITNNEWNHMVVTQTGSALKMYVNGTEIDISYIKGAAGVWYGTVAGDTFAVGVLDRGTPDAWFNGLIDELGIWDRAITSAEVTELWNGGAGISYPFPVDIKPSTLTLTLTGEAPTPIIIPVVTGALALTLTLMMPTVKVKNMTGTQGTVSTRTISKNWPGTSGTTTNTKHAGRQINLVAEGIHGIKTTVYKKQKEGLNG